MPAVLYTSVNPMKGMSIMETKLSAADAGALFDHHARIEVAVEEALQAFWTSVAESYPEVTSGDFDPMLEGLMISQASEWVEHWVAMNAPRTP